MSAPTSGNFSLGSHTPKSFGATLKTPSKGSHVSVKTSKVAAPKLKAVKAIAIPKGTTPRQTLAQTLAKLNTATKTPASSPLARAAAVKPRSLPVKQILA